MHSADFVLFTLQVTLMLACAAAGGHVMRRLGQPAVLGEMLGGILLGPTLFGALAPELWERIFRDSPGVTVARDAAIKLGMLFFLFVAGLEVDLSDLRRLGRRAAFIGLVGTLLPIATGVALVYATPETFWGPLAGTNRLALGLFIGMNLANSANPVIARVLMDLGLLQAEFGTIVMTATVVDDLVNWTLFAIVLGQIAPPSATSVAGDLGLGMGIVLVLVFCVGGEVSEPFRRRSSDGRISGRRGPETTEGAPVGSALRFRLGACGPGSLAVDRALEQAFVVRGERVDQRRGQVRAEHVAADRRDDEVGDQGVGRVDRVGGDGRQRSAVGLVE